MVNLSHLYFRVPPTFYFLVELFILLFYLLHQSGNTLRAGIRLHTWLFPPLCLVYCLVNEQWVLFNHSDAGKKTMLLKPGLWSVRLRHIMGQQEIEDQQEEYRKLCAIALLLPILQPSPYLCSLLCDFPYASTEGIVYFSAPLMLGIVIWLALANEVGTSDSVPALRLSLTVMCFYCQSRSFCHHYDKKLSWVALWSREDERDTWKRPICNLRLDPVEPGPADSQPTYRLKNENKWWFC